MKASHFTAIALLGGWALVGCGHEGNGVPGPRHVPNPAVDNLYVQPPFEGASNMSLDVVSFRLRQRCLEVVWNGKAFTPAFQSPVDDISVTASHVALPYITLSFGKGYSVQGPLVPGQIQEPIKPGCPQQVLLIAGLGSLEGVPKPATPPRPF